MSTATETTDLILKTLIFDVALKEVISRLIVLAPFLAYPVINPVFVFIMTKIAGLFYEQLAEFVAFQVIDFQVGSERKAYEDAVRELRGVLNPVHGEVDRDQVDSAKEEVRRRLRDLVRIRP